MSDHDEPLTGEIVGPVPLLDGDEENRYRRGGRRSGGGGFYDEDTISEAIRARALGFTLKQIADKLDVSHESVRIWCNEANAKRQYGPADMAKVRADMVIELQAAEHEALRIVRTAPGTELALKALNTYNSLLRTHANLVGAVAPTQVHVEVKEVSETDAELRDMIAESRAAAANKVMEMNRQYARRNKR